MNDTLFLGTLTGRGFKQFLRPNVRHFPVAWRHSFQYRDFKPLYHFGPTATWQKRSWPLWLSIFILPTLTIILMTKEEHYNTYMLQNTTTLIIILSCIILLRVVVTALQTAGCFGKDFYSYFSKDTNTKKSDCQTTTTKRKCPEKTTLHEESALYSSKLYLFRCFSNSQNKSFTAILSRPCTWRSVSLIDPSISDPSITKFNPLYSTRLKHTHMRTTSCTLHCLSGAKMQKSSPRVACASSIVSSVLPLYV